MEKQSYMPESPSNAQYFSHIPQTSNFSSPQGFSPNPDSPEMSNLATMQSNRATLTSGFDPNFSLNYDEILCMGQARGTSYISPSTSFIPNDLPRGTYTSSFQRLSQINSDVRIAFFHFKTFYLLSLVFTNSFSTH